MSFSDVYIYLYLSPKSPISKLQEIVVGMGALLYITYIVHTVAQSDFPEKSED